MPDTLITTEAPPTLVTDEVLTPPTPTMFRFPDEATGMAYLRDADLTYMDNDNDDDVEVERVFTASHRHSLDVIGTITRGGEWDDEGNVITPPETLDGWHVNYQGKLPEGWEEYAVYPANPVRVWA